MEDGKYNYKKGTKMKRTILFFLVIIEIFFIKNISHTKEVSNNYKNNEYKDLISTFTTYYDSSNVSRENNLILSANKINNHEIKSGEEFSYNKVVGKRTIENGYDEAKAYIGGKISKDIGGGVCQISSTLYNAIILANLEVTERHNHFFKVSYLPVGQDATVSWNSSDFKFINNRNNPIKIEAIVGDGIVKINIYGTKSENEYEVKIESNIIETIKSQTIYENDYTLEKGIEKIVQNGEDGYISETYKLLIKDNKIYSKKLLSKDIYNQLPTIIKTNK